MSGWTELAAGETAIKLHVAAGELFATWGGQLRRWAGGALAPIAADLVTVDGAGAETGRRAPVEIDGVYGRWPDRAWIAVNFGWSWVGPPGGGPGSPAPLRAFGRWDGACFVERGGLPGLAAWTDAALVVSLHGPAFADPDERTPPAGRTQVAGRHGFELRRDGARVAWWHHRPGAAAPAPLDAPFAATEQVWLAAGPDDRLFAVADDGRARTAAMLAGADRWQPLPAPPGRPLGTALDGEGTPWLLATDPGAPPMGAAPATLLRLERAGWRQALLPPGARATGLAAADGRLFVTTQVGPAATPRFSLLASPGP